MHACTRVHTNTHARTHARTQNALRCCGSAAQRNVRRTWQRLSVLYFLVVCVHALRASGYESGLQRLLTGLIYFLTCLRRSFMTRSCSVYVCMHVCVVSWACAGVQCTAARRNALAALHFTMLHCAESRAAPHRTAPHRTVPTSNPTPLHRIAPHRTAPHRTAPHHTTPHRTAPHRTAPHRIALQRTAYRAVSWATEPLVHATTCHAMATANRMHPNAHQRACIRTEKSRSIWP